MKMKFPLILAFLLLSLFTVNAQQAMFLHKGKIEFERRINMHAMIDNMTADDDGNWKDIAKQQYPKFVTTYYDFWFADSVTLYRPGRENPDNSRLRELPADQNIVYSMLNSWQSISRKKVFEQTYLVQDSMRSINWKITEETRNIAGFDCRRANAIIMDSIYVVAFYTDQIVPPGGPESFAGLPGMILGVALPHEHITWFATKVLVEDVNPSQLQPEKKGRKTTRKEMHEALMAALEGWGTYGKQYIKQAEF